jgi:hypothetical protein
MLDFTKIMFITILCFLALVFVYRFFDFFYTLYIDDKKNKKTLHKPKTKNNGKD